MITTYANFSNNNHNYLLAEQSYFKQKNIYSFYGLIIIISLIININSATVFIQTPAQAGQAQLTLTSTDVYPALDDIRFFVKYNIPLKILNSVGQIYQIVLGFRKMDLCFSAVGAAWPSTAVTALRQADSSASSTFQLNFYIEDQSMLTKVIVNYLLIGSQLTSGSLVMSRDMSISSILCDSLAAPQSCIYTKSNPLALPHLNYKVYLSITSLNLQSYSSTIVMTSVTIAGVPTPIATTSATTIQSKIQLVDPVLTFTSITFKINVENIKLTYLLFYLIVVHPDMFNTSIIRKTVFIEYSKIITSVSTISNTFAVDVLKQNFFIGLFRYKGIQWDFQFTQSNPINNKLSASIYSGSTLIQVFGFVMYGYTQTCKLYKYCIACYVSPIYDCTKCQKNFVITLPANTNTACQCQSPYSLVSGICDIIIFGCMIAERLPGGSIACHQCDLSKYLFLNSTTQQCECTSKYYMDSNSICQDLCGDGIKITLACDDGNTNPGDGCSPTCELQTGFTCDVIIQPTKCKSSAILIYMLDEINKNQQRNSAIIKLKLKNSFNYPFPVYKQEFNPNPSHLNFKIILSQSTYQQLVVTNFQIIDVDENNCMFIQFFYSTTVENTKAKILLNYEHTYYWNYTQAIEFKLIGNNQPLKFDNKMQLYSKIGYAMIAVTILNCLMLLVGFFTSKFIGLQSILILQIMYFSQILVYDNFKFPIGFMFISSFQYTTGFNAILNFTDYIPFTDTTIKMHHIKRKKMIIENFNINFLILTVFFILLIVSFLIRKNKEKNIEQKKRKRFFIKDQSSDHYSKQIKQSLFIRIINDKIFYISNQVAFWLFLPLISSIAAQILIENSALRYKPNQNATFLESKTGEFITLFGCLMIFWVILSNFANLWQSNQSMIIAYERPQQARYKRWLFIYLNIVGYLIFFMYDIYIENTIYCSVIVMIVQLAHLIIIYFINPYQQSLKVHTFGMMFSNAILLIWLVAINLINYLDEINQNFIVILGIGINVCCEISIVLTVIRLYYELRYGRDLQDKIQEERLKKILQQRLRKQQQLRRKISSMQDQVRRRTNEKQKIRDKNIYLYENQIKQDDKNQLLLWLQRRNLLDQKTKDANYLDKFDDKPLDWLKVNDKTKYDKKVNEMRQHMQRDRNRQLQKSQDEYYRQITMKLKKQVGNIKKSNNYLLHKHEQMMKKDINYVMNIKKSDKDRFIHPAYDIKQ